MARPLTKYTFRVDEVDGVTRDSVKQFLAKFGGRHVVCYEVSDVTKKPHYQGWVELSLSQQTWQNRIKDAFPAVRGSTRGRGNGKYSAAIVRKDTYEHYILKGTPTDYPDVVSMQLAIGEHLDIESIHRQWWSRHASTAHEKKVHIVQEGIEVFRSTDWGTDDIHAKRAVVLKWIMNKYEGKGHSSFLFKNYLNGILNVVSPDHSEEFERQIVYADKW